jgi:molybdopterin/thiamine biosynthesis adenylyltransferase
MAGERKPLFTRTNVIGLGGIFSRLAVVLAEHSRFLPGAPQEIMIADGDEVEKSNIERQGFSEDHIKRKKADVWAERLKRQYAKFALDIIPFPEFIVPDNVSNIIKDGSITIGAVDNNATRKLLSKHIQTLTNAIFISGGNELTDGNVQLYVQLGGKSRTLPIEKSHPEIEDPKDKNPGEMSCEERLALPGGGQLVETNMEVARITATFFRKIIEAYREPDQWKEVEEGKTIAEVWFDIKDSSSLGYYRCASEVQV